MGIEIGLLAQIVGATSAVVGAVEGIKARNDAKDAAGRAAEEQRKARAEQAAGNAATAAAEKRQQIREERVRRARILQGAENTGVEGSSGEMGAIGSLSTQLGANLGFNLGAIQRAENIGVFNQNAANAGTDLQNAQINASNADSLFGIGASLFSKAGGSISGGSIFQRDPVAEFIKGTRGSGD